MVFITSSGWVTCAWEGYGGCISAAPQPCLFCAVLMPHRERFEKPSPSPGDDFTFFKSIKSLKKCYAKERVKCKVLIKLKCQFCYKGITEVFGTAACSGGKRQRAANFIPSCSPGSIRDQIRTLSKPFPGSGLLGHWSKNSTYTILEKGPHLRGLPSLKCLLLWINWIYGVTLSLY